MTCIICNALNEVEATYEEKIVMAFTAGMINQTGVDMVICDNHEKMIRHHIHMANEAWRRQQEAADDRSLSPAGEKDSN